MPATAPIAKPPSTRQSVAQTWVHSSPWRRGSQSVARMRLGGGTSRPWRGRSEPPLPSRGRARRAEKSREARASRTARALPGEGRGRESGGSLGGEDQALARRGVGPSRRSPVTDVISAARWRSGGRSRPSTAARTSCRPGSRRPAAGRGRRPGSCRPVPGRWCECVSSVRSSCRAITGVGQLGVRRPGPAAVPSGLASDQVRASS